MATMPLGYGAALAELRCTSRIYAARPRPPARCRPPGRLGARGESDMIVLLFLVAVVVLAVIAGSAGPDSRDGNDWSHSPRP